jgi:hypothetical protein
VFLIILILSLLSNFFFPWWSIACFAFITAFLIGQAGNKVFWSGFFAVFIAWIILALFKSVPNDHIMAGRMALLFKLPHWTFVLLISAVMGAVIGGLSALSGLLVKLAFFNKRTNSNFLNY